MLCRNHVDVSDGVRLCSRCRSSFCGDCLVSIQGRDYCAVCKSEQVMDLRSGTAVGELPLASVGRRFAALWLDRFFAIIALLVIGIPLVLLASTSLKSLSDEVAGFGILSLIAFVVIAFVSYEALMLRSRGATLGKMVMKLRVVRPDGSPLSTGQAWGRAISRIVMIHILALLNYGAAVVTKEKTCIHDMLARTRVVNAE